MELCTARTISNITRPTLFSPHQTRLRLRTSLPFNHLAFPRSNPGLLYYTNSSVRSTTSEDTSGSPSQYVGLEPGSVAVEDEKPSEKNSYPEIREEGVPKEVSPVDDQVPAFEFLDNLDIKVDSEDTYSLLLFGGGALIAVWIATTVVSAIDSIPLFPKLLEVVGLGYTVWFSTRYLIFKENREELVAKIEEIKLRVLGSK
ncbi:protein CURVATURE THYLAKOID 1D, chloroplastic isoform X1 [Diospyros lotus]|uniref:protein CURVATURE THYLAKOID 1D, chloroplastic isoform X1 n=1 Tax=Diospyros lotus TaxID=55363 RepID=UPI002251743B|nr:protein CURVATURE THYLAKOID 1D, chloroplastic isoform X1 [Diospyros lotus]